MTKGSSNYEKVRRILKQRLNEPSVRLKGQYSIRLYQWAKQYLAVGYKRISITTFRKILGLEDIQDNSGRVVRQAPLELWANLKQRALDRALEEWPPARRQADPYRLLGGLGTRSL
jgi:hypothetical protein